MKKKRIVILGAGFSGIYTYKRLHSIFHKDESVEIVLVNKTNYFLFTPLLHEVATGSIHDSNITQPIRKVLDCCLADLYVADVNKINCDKKIVQTTIGDISYDYLVMGLGSETHFFGMDIQNEVHTLKTLDDARRLKNTYIDIIEQASKIKDKKEQEKKLRIAIIGGGPTGVELAAETAEFFRHTFAKYYPKELVDRVHIDLIQRGEELVPMFNPYIRKKATERLKKLGVHIRTNTAVTDIQNGVISLSSEKNIEASTIVWVAGVQPVDIHMTSEKHIEKTQKGCLVVEPTLQLAGHTDIFVLGDQAHCLCPDGTDPLPALAQVAVKQGKTAAENIAALIDGNKPTVFLYKKQGMLISLGQWMAAGEIGPFHFSGGITWWFWRTIYLSKLISWRKRFKVALDWTLNLFSPRDMSEF